MPQYFYLIKLSVSFNEIMKYSILFFQVVTAILRDLWEFLATMKEGVNVVAILMGTDANLVVKDSTTSLLVKV